MAVDRSLLQTLLQLKHPWSVLEYEMDPARRRLDIWVGTATSNWFGIVRRSHDTSAEQVWRHDNIGMFASFVHMNTTREAEIPVAPWCNLGGFPFSRSVTQRARALIADGASVKSIGLALGMTPEEVWKLRHVAAPSETTAGGQHSGTAQVAAPVAQVAPVRMSAEVAPAGVPEVDDPVWRRLADGMNIDIRVLSLKLLLSRVRSQMQGITDPDISLLHLSELHRYFVRHERILGHELSQLRGH